MRFMIVVKATKDSEAGVKPPEELFADMADYHEQLAKAGVLLDASGLQPSSKGWRVKYSGGKRTIIDGPFTEAKELIAGYTHDPGEVARGGDRMVAALPQSHHRRKGLRDRGPAAVRARGFRRERNARPVPRDAVSPRRNSPEPIRTDYRSNDDAIHFDGENERGEVEACRPRRSWTRWTSSCKRPARTAASWSRELVCCRPPSGMRVRLAGGKVTVTDGPFTEAKEVVGGYAIFDAPSKAQMLKWTERFMDLHKKHMPGWEGECEVRQIAGPGPEALRASPRDARRRE